uniref:DsbC family protein n=1 Tax=Thermodesulfobacterium geofontis TaxID=1295609 RepID=A0A7V6CD63_9BACT
MKKVMLFLIIIFLILLNSALVNLALAGITKEKLLENAPQLKKSLESIPEKVSIEAVNEMDSFYEVVLKVRGEKKILYLTKDFKYMILGSLIDRDNKNITKERLKELNKIDISTLPLKDALVYKNGNGTKKIVVFVDPFCPHCKNLINYLKQQKDFTLYMFIFPLSQKSEEAGIKILCSPNPLDAYLNPENLKETCEEGEKKLFFHSLFARSLYLKGAPFVILEDGSNFYGFNKDLLDKFFTQ